MLTNMRTSPSRPIESLKMASQSGERLSLQQVFSNFQTLLAAEGEMKTDEFTAACQSVLPFIGCMGILMKPVSSAVSDKVELLGSYNNGDGAENYVTLRKLVVYEDGMGITRRNPRKGYDTGCYAVRHLSWTVLFMQHFFAELAELDEDTDTIYYCASRAYERSLAQYHNWFVRNTAYILMNFLPSKSSLLQHIEGSHMEIQEQARSGSVTLERVYSHVYSLLDEFDLVV